MALGFTAGVVLGFALLAASLWWWPKPATVGTARQGQPTLEELKRTFARPTYLPAPADNPATPAKLALGQRLFEDKRLSVTGTISCSSCHDPKLALTDGESTGRGVSGRPLVRHTPSLWNVAFSPLLMWDGRASSLEDQIRLPLTHPDEMGATYQHAVERLSADADYVRAFAEAFPGSPGITSETIAQGARRLRALAGVAAHPVRQVDCRRRIGPVAERAERICHFHWSRPLHQLPHRLRLHRPRLL